MVVEKDHAMRDGGQHLRIVLVATGASDTGYSSHPDMRIVAGTHAEPSSHKVRNQNRLILCAGVAKLNQCNKKSLSKIS